MNLMDCLMDEFHDEEIVKGLNEREIASWIEVYIQNIIYNCKKNYKDVLINDELFDVVKKDQKFFQVFFKCVLLQFITTVEKKPTVNYLLPSVNCLFHTLRACQKVVRI